MDLSPSELIRYQKQIVLPNIGREGQLRLKKARVLCIGAGGLGCPLLLYLAAAGIGTIGIVDDDRISESNLHRQILYRTQDIGQLKIIIAAKTLSALNPEIQINTYPVRLESHNAPALFADHDIVVDGTDNRKARYILNQTSLLQQKPWLFASVEGLAAQVGFFSGEGGPCYQCLFPDKDVMRPTCQENGILGVIPAMVANIQATEVLKYLLGLPVSLLNTILLYDAERLNFKKINLSADPNCVACSKNKGSNQMNVEQEVHIPEMTLSELYALRETTPDLQLIDVRSPMEHEQYNIGGVLRPLDISLNSAVLTGSLAEFDPEKLTVVYCRAGKRSHVAAQILLNAGFKQVQQLKGGLNGASI